jgi:hypothetical protein
LNERRELFRIGGSLMAAGRFDFPILLFPFALSFAIFAKFARAFNCAGEGFLLLDFTVFNLFFLAPFYNFILKTQAAWL